MGRLFCVKLFVLKVT